MPRRKGRAGSAIGSQNASQDASQPSLQGGGQPPAATGEIDVLGRQLMEMLNSLKGALESAPGLTQETKTILEMQPLVRALWEQAGRTPIKGATPATPPQDLSQRLDRIESALRDIKKGTEAGSPVEGSSRGGLPTGLSYAAVAAQGKRMANLPIQQRTAVRVQIPDAREKTQEEIMNTVRPHIHGAIAVKTLYSGTVEVMVPDQATKDRAMTITPTENFRVMKQEYHLLVTSVPLVLEIQTGQTTDNKALLQQLNQQTRKLIPGFHATKIRWLLDARTRAERKEKGQRASSVVLTVTTQAHQHAAVRKGVILDSAFCEASLHDLRTESKQCFNCLEWGHTQNACQKQAYCGRCAGNHQTRDCKETTVSCHNCGKHHKAWQKRECRTYHTYRDTLQALRLRLHIETMTIRASPAPISSTIDAQGFTLVGHKRARTESNSTSSQGSGRVGRPDGFRVAARDPAQARILTFTTPSISSQSASVSPGTNSPVGSQDATDEEM
jgi:hypothetical protein